MESPLAKPYGPRQEYIVAPTCAEEVRGCSSQTIYKFMTSSSDLQWWDAEYYIHDVDDWERCRALLLCFPEWKPRLPEMARLSREWKNVVSRWSAIETLYVAEIVARGHHDYYGGACCAFIKSLVK